MKQNTNIVSDVSWRARLGAFIFLFLMGLTIVPFNFLHGHEEISCLHSISSLEDGSLDSISLEDSLGQCDHKAHIGQQQQACLLCQFDFLPSGPVVELSLDAVSIHGVAIDYADLYNGRSASAAIDCIHNKGSPTA